MKNTTVLAWRWCVAGWLAVLGGLGAKAAPATLLFEDDFNRGIPGWTAVQPPGNYLDGPMRWQYDIVSGAFVEQSNIYTDAATVSPTATAVMLVNEAVAGEAFTYRARMVAGDDDAFGLVFGYQDPTNFYRVTFTRQVRTTPGFPWNGWNVDRKANGVATNLFGDGTAGHVGSFVNRQYVPFDVTVAVTAGNVLTLTVVDDPEGAPLEYRLVEGQPLPGSAAGRVGLMQWGQSGTAVRGFRVLNPTLEPTPLAGDPNALAGWTPVVTLADDGTGLDASTGNGGIPIWSLALGPNGAYGTLHENSDSFGGNTAEGVIDFPAATLVAGDAGWSNYVYTARLIPADDDGQGVVLRYQDERNFYRIALRAQSSPSGVRRGLSVQKVVDGVWEEVFAEATPQFAPPSNVPYDLTAVMVGQRLQIQVVANPLGAAQTFNYGPFEMQGATLATGRIGVFSWAMSRLEVDFVRVYGIDGVPLQVSSAYGSPEPPVGLQGYAAGTVVEASVASPVEEAPGVRRLVTGWTGVGSVPASGTGSQVGFRLNEVSSLTWQWATELRLSVAVGAGGQVTGLAGEWLPEGTAVMLKAVPDAGFLFVGWTGDLGSCGSDLALTMVRPLTLAARFEEDSDGDGMADAWEREFFGGLQAAPGEDADGDLRSNRVEYEAGTNPRYAEVVIVADGLGSRWENVQRDPALPGQMVVRDFGAGFRGVWENSNDYRGADDATFIGADAVAPLVSFEGPRMVVRTNVWDPAWADFTAEVTFSVGDNDGNCVYFRYRDELNWYRVTICGENNNAAWRAPFGVSVQKRSGGYFTELAADPSMATDPTDAAFYKRVRVTVKAQGAEFEVRVAGWNTLVAPPEWDMAGERLLVFSDADHATGRLGVGLWGQSGGGPATATNPVDAGALIEDVVVTVGGQEVMREDWGGVPLAAELPSGWMVSAGDPGVWQVTAHGSLMQTTDYGTATAGTVVQPKADGEGTVLVSPVVEVADYVVEARVHPFDNDGVGIVFDYVDGDNYSRVVWVSEATAAGRVPQGLSVSRKANGVWSDVLVGDGAFVYEAGRPFVAALASRAGRFTLTAHPVDDAGAVRRWTWAGVPTGAGRRVGVTCWGSTDAHFAQVRVSRMAEPGVGALRISGVSVEGGMLVLEVENPGGGSYAVERSATLEAGGWSEVATGQTGAQWSTSWSGAAGGWYYRLRRQP